MNRLADLLPGVVAQLAATHTATNGEPPMTDDPATEELLRRAADALRAVSKAALVVQATLDKPYADAPDTTPWKRFMEQPARDAYNLSVELRRAIGRSA